MPQLSPDGHPRRRNPAGFARGMSAGRRFVEAAQGHRQKATTLTRFVGNRGFNGVVSDFWTLAAQSAASGSADRASDLRGAFEQSAGKIQGSRNIRVREQPRIDVRMERNPFSLMNLIVERQRTQDAQDSVQGAGKMMHLVR